MTDTDLHQAMYIMEELLTDTENLINSKFDVEAIVDTILRYDPAYQAENEEPGEELIPRLDSRALSYFSKWFNHSKVIDYEQLYHSCRLGAAVAMCETSEETFESMALAIRVKYENDIKVRRELREKSERRREAFNSKRYSFKKEDVCDVSDEEAEELKAVEKEKADMEQDAKQNIEENYNNNLPYVPIKYEFLRNVMYQHVKNIGFNYDNTLNKLNEDLGIRINLKIADTKLLTFAKGVA